MSFTFDGASASAFIDSITSHASVSANPANEMMTAISTTSVSSSAPISSSSSSASSAALLSSTSSSLMSSVSSSISSSSSASRLRTNSLAFDPLPSFSPPSNATLAHHNPSAVCLEETSRLSFTEYQTHPHPLPPHAAASFVNGHSHSRASSAEHHDNHSSNQSSHAYPSSESSTPYSLSVNISGTSTGQSTPMTLASPSMPTTNGAAPSPRRRKADEFDNSQQEYGQQQQQQLSLLSPSEKRTKLIGSNGMTTAAPVPIQAQAIHPGHTTFSFHLPSVPSYPQHHPHQPPPTMRVPSPNMGRVAMPPQLSPRPQSAAPRLMMQGSYSPMMASQIASHHQMQHHQHPQQFQIQFSQLHQQKDQMQQLQHPHAMLQQQQQVYYANHSISSPNPAVKLEMRSSPVPAMHVAMAMASPQPHQSHLRINSDAELLSPSLNGSEGPLSVEVEEDDGEGNRSGSDIEGNEIDGSENEHEYHNDPCIPPSPMNGQKDEGGVNMESPSFKARSTQAKKALSLTCSHCGACFANEVMLYGHFLSVHGQAICPNPSCHQLFADQSTLQQHLVCHARGRPHICSFCGEGFNQSGHAKEHARMHTGDKPFACPVEGCGHAFSRNGYLKQHSRIHTGEKRFVCSTCGKGFRQSSTLKRHTRIHSGEKPYPCSFCGKTFRHSNTRKDHEASQHEKQVAARSAAAAAANGQHLLTPPTSAMATGGNGMYMSPIPSPYSSGTSSPSMSPRAPLPPPQQQQQRGPTHFQYAMMTEPQLRL